MERAFAIDMFTWLPMVGYGKRSESHLPQSGDCPLLYGSYRNNFNKTLLDRLIYVKFTITYGYELSAYWSVRIIIFSFKPAVIDL